MDFERRGIRFKQSIDENELYDTIVVNQNGIIIDGYQRYKACHELGIKQPKKIVRVFADSTSEQKYRIDKNINRRHLTDFQRIELLEKLAIIENEANKAAK